MSSRIGLTSIVVAIGALLGICGVVDLATAAKPGGGTHTSRIFYYTWHVPYVTYQMYEDGANKTTVNLPPGVTASPSSGLSRATGAAADGTATHGGVKISSEPSRKATMPPTLNATPVTLISTSSRITLDCSAVSRKMRRSSARSHRWRERAPRSAGAVSRGAISDDRSNKPVMDIASGCSPARRKRM